MFLDIIMISEDHVTEDWSNDAENTEIVEHIFTEKTADYNNIYFAVLCIFYQINVVYDFFISNEGL